MLPFGMTEVGIGMICLVLPIWAVVYGIKKRRGNISEHDAPFLLQVVLIAMGSA